MVYVLDAHALLWYLEDERNLGTAARAVFLSPEARLIVPAIALAEVLWALRKKRTDEIVWERILSTIREDKRFVVYSIDLEVIAATTAELEMHDALICAVAAVVSRWASEEVLVVTKDSAIVNSGLVQTVW